MVIRVKFDLIGVVMMPLFPLFAPTAVNKYIMDVFCGRLVRACIVESAVVRKGGLRLRVRVSNASVGQVERDSPPCERLGFCAKSEVFFFSVVWTKDLTNNDRLPAVRLRSREWYGCAVALVDFGRTLNESYPILLLYIMPCAPCPCVARGRFLILP